MEGLQGQQAWVAAKPALWISKPSLSGQSQVGLAELEARMKPCTPAISGEWRSCHRPEGPRLHLRLRLVIGEGAAHAVKEAKKQEDAEKQTASSHACFGNHVDAFEQKKTEAGYAGETGITRESERDATEQGRVQESGAVDGNVVHLGAGNGEKRKKGCYAGNENGAPHGDFA